MKILQFLGLMALGASLYAGQMHSGAPYKPHKQKARGDEDSNFSCPSGKECAPTGRIDRFRCMPKNNDSKPNKQWKVCGQTFCCRPK
jgi:hypothetical protein